MELAEMYASGLMTDREQQEMERRLKAGDAAMRAELERVRPMLEAATGCGRGERAAATREGIEHRVAAAGEGRQVGGRGHAAGCGAGVRRGGERERKSGGGSGMVGRVHDRAGARAVDSFGGFAACGSDALLGSEGESPDDRLADGPGNGAAGPRSRGDGRGVSGERRSFDPRRADRLGPGDYFRVGGRSRRHAADRGADFCCIIVSGMCRTA